jgi:hypothetical protein
LRRATLVALFLACWLLLGSDLAQAKEVGQAAQAVTLLGNQATARTVTLAETDEGILSGQLTLAVRSSVGGRLTALYYPTGDLSDEAAGKVDFVGDAPTLSAGEVTSTALAFTLPAKASPQDLEGVVVLRAKVAGKTKGAGAELNVSGTGSTLPGVSIRPAKLTMQVVDDLGPLDDPGSAYANVQLSGPGVPSLFRAGYRPPTFNLLLRSDHGDKARATLTDLEQAASPNLATATVQVHGDLGAGKFEGETPISNLSTEAPKLLLTVEAGDLFIWPALAVFLGTVLGGGLYLASNRNRRKALLRDQLKAMLMLYEKQLKALGGEGSLPLWSLSRYLGPSPTWYRVKWNSVVNLDGAVRTAWSEIHWARDEGDLDQAAAKVGDAKVRIVRWLTAANGVATLAEAATLNPATTIDTPWKPTCARKDTADLLQLIRQLEPVDDTVAAGLIERINRQTHWHTVLARLWNARAILVKAMEAGGYEEHAKAEMRAIDLATLDRNGAPESGRSLEKQIAVEREVADAMETIVATYKGNPDDLELMVVTAGSEHKPAREITNAGAVYGSADPAMLAADPTEATRAAGTESVRGAAGETHEGERIPIAVAGVLRRDLAWTVAIALVSSVAYISTIYTPSWGTLTDYITAFAAGFVGKAAISWAALPLFQSLRGVAAPAAPVPSSPTAAAAPAPAPAPAAAVAPTAAPTQAPPAPAS